MLLLVYLYMVVEICSMETEGEGTDNWVKLWTLMNSMIKSYLDDPSA